MNQKREYIDKLTEYFFYKYIYSIFLENKYISNFAEYEIEKMQSIYETFLYDKAIENRFVFGYISPNISNEFNSILAKEEYKDLAKQISVLKRKSLTSVSTIKYIKDVLNRGILSKIAKIIENVDPYLSAGDNTKNWNDMIYALENRKFEDIFKMSEKYEVKVKDSDNIIDFVPKDIKEKTCYYENKILELYEFFPFNEEKTLYTKKNINEKINEIKKETTKSKETLKRITNVYLYTDDINGLES